MLLDSGASSSLITSRLAKHQKLTSTKSDTVWTTAAGELTTTSTSKMFLELPDLSPTIALASEAHIANSLGRYDIMLGRKHLRELGIKLDFETNEVQWRHLSVPMVTTEDIEDNMVTFKEP